jgi:acyl dehydratase
MARLTLTQLLQLEGQDIGRSDWISVNQGIIDEFAKCTGDHQWIHVDVERAGRESPSGATIAHGFLTLALVAPLAMELGLQPDGVSAVVNYGLEKVRFITPVKCGDRIRLQLAIAGTERKDDGRYLIRSKAVLEIDNVASPALVAEMLTMIVP